MPRILFVSGFHPATRAKDLAYEFERFGPLVRCDVPAPRNPNAHTNPYAFIEFRSSRDAEDAYYDMHGRNFEGSRLSIQWAKNPPSSIWRYERRSPTRRRDRRRSRSPRRRDDRDRDRERDRERDRDGDANRDSDRDADRDRTGDADRDRELDRERNRDTDRDRHRERRRSRSPERKRSLSPDSKPKDDSAKTPPPPEEITKDEDRAQTPPYDH